MGCLLFLTVTFVYSVVRYVSQDLPTGGDPCSIGTPCGFAEALGIAQDGDSILLTNGVYNSDLGSEKNIDIELTIEGETRDGVILEGDLYFRLDSGNPFTLKRLTVRNTVSTFLVIGSSNWEEVEVEEVRFESVYTPAIEVYRSSTLTLRNLEGEDFGTDGSFIKIEECNTFSLSDSSFNNGNRIGHIEDTNTVIISNSSFVGSDLSINTHGGSFFIWNGINLDISDCVFEDIKAVSFGGAVYIGYIDMTSIENTQFISCSTDYTGGAIYIEHGEINIISSSFTSCVTVYNGGAVSTDDATVSIEDTEFTSCSGEEGGAVFHSNGVLSITSSNFTSCVATDDGGAVSQTNGELSITSSIFTFCVAGFRGGAVYVEDADGEIRISSSEFTSCSADYYGGAVYFEDADGELRVSSSNFTNCTAEIWGGAINILDANSLIEYSEFTSCSAYSRGGAIYQENGDIAVISSNFMYCTAPDFCYQITGESLCGGGAVHFYNTSSLVDDCNFINCSAYQGGGIKQKLGEITTTSSNFKNCFASEGGGGIFMRDIWTVGVVSSSSFSHCVSNLEGGGVKAESGEKIIVTDCVFEYCEAVYFKGGGLLIQVDFVVSSSNFSFCKAGSKGGAMFVDIDIEFSYQRVYAFSSILDCSFTSCSSIEGGGVALPAVTGTNPIIFERCMFYKCSSELGGGIRYYVGPVKVLGSTFLECTAESRGGGIYGTEPDNRDLEVSSSIFTSNDAELGGGIYLGPVSGSDLSIFISYSTFSNNSARFGAGIYASEIEEVELEVINTEFRMNYAWDSGAAAYLSSVDFEMDSCEFENNYAVEHGGSILADNPKSYGILEDCVFTSDYAGNDGGSLAIWDKEHEFKLYVSGTQFENTRSVGGDGGAIWLNGLNFMYFDTVNMINCGSPNGYGGALFVENSVIDGVENCSIIVRNSRIELSNALEGGGFYVAIYGVHGLHVIEDTFFSMNSAQERGGCFYLDDKNIDNNYGKWRFTGMDFLHCEVLGNGGGAGMYVQNAGELFLEDSHLSNCSTSIGNGGGMYVVSTENLQVSESTFSSCSAVEGGGIYFYQSDSVTFENSMFEYCSSSGIFIGNVVTQSFRLWECRFLGNKGLEKGAALYGTFSSISDLPDEDDSVSLEIIDCIFENNQVIEDINCESDSLQGIVLHAISLVSDEAEAGSLVIDGIQVLSQSGSCPPFYFETFQYGDITGSVDNVDSSVESFYFWMENIAHLDIFDISFHQGSKMNSLIHSQVTENSFITLLGLDNSASVRDSEFYGDNSISSELYEISENSFFDISSMNVRVTQTTITDGGITVGGHVTISECTFENHCRIFTPNTEELTIEDNIFSDCSEKIVDTVEDAPSNYVLNFEDGLRIRRNEFRGEGFKGTVFKFGGKGDVEVSDMDISSLDISPIEDDNDVSSGFLYFYDVEGEVSIEDCIFSSLSISTPLMFVLRIGSVRRGSHQYTIRNCDFSNIQVSVTSSGVIFSDFIEEEEGEESLISIIDSSFENNVNTYGKGVVINSKGRLRFINSVFEDNSAYEGSNIYSEGGLISLEGTTSFSYTSSESQALSGGVHIHQGKIEIHDDVLFYDSIDLSCLYLFDSGFVIDEGVVFEKCRTGGYGGAISYYGTANVDDDDDIDDDGVIRQYGGNYVECEAVMGGGAISAIIYSDEPLQQTHKFLIGDGTTFERCTSEYGGAIYLKNVNLNFSCVEESTSTFSTLIFNGNLADNLGSAIFIDGGLLDVDFTSCGFSSENVLIQFDYNMISRGTSWNSGCIFDHGFSFEKRDELTGRVLCEYQGDTELCFKDYFLESVYGENSLELKTSDYELFPPIYSIFSSYEVEMKKGVEPLVSTELPIRVIAGQRLTLNFDSKDVRGNTVPIFEDITQVISFVETTNVEYKSDSLNQIVGNPFTGITFSKKIQIDMSQFSNTTNSSLEENIVIQTLEFGLQIVVEDDDDENEYLFSQFSIPIWIEGCPPGYYRVEDGDFYSCIPCPDERYNTKSESAECYECPDNAECPDGDGVVTDPDFWSYIDQDGIAVVLFCPSGNCEGDNLCVEGYNNSEPVCASCVSGFSEWGGACIDCNSGFTFFSFVAISFGIVTFLWSVYTTHQNSKNTESTIERIFSFFGQTYTFSLRNMSWGTLLKVFGPILAVLTSFQLPSTSDSDNSSDTSDESNSVESIFGTIFYPITLIFSILFDCPFPRSSYFVIWSGYLEPLILFVIIVGLLLISIFVVCCQKYFFVPSIELAKKGIIKKSSSKKKKKKKNSEEEIDDEDDDDKELEDQNEDDDEKSEEESDDDQSVDDEEKSEEEETDDEEEGGSKLESSNESSSGEETDEDNNNNNEKSDDDGSTDITSNSSSTDDEKKNEDDKNEEQEQWKTSKKEEIDEILNIVKQNYEYLEKYIEKAKEMKEEEKETLDDITEEEPVVYWKLCLEDEVRNRKKLNWSHFENWCGIVTGCACFCCICTKIIKKIFRKKKTDPFRWSEIRGDDYEEEKEEKDQRVEVIKFINEASAASANDHDESSDDDDDDEDKKKKKSSEDEDDDDEDEQQQNVKMNEIRSKFDEDKENFKNLSIQDGDEKKLKCSLTELKILKLSQTHEDYKKYLDIKYKRYFQEEEEEEKEEEKEKDNNMSVLRRYQIITKVKKELKKERKLLKKRKKQLNKKKSYLRQWSPVHKLISNIGKKMKVPKLKDPFYIEIGPFIGYICFGIPSVLFCSIFSFFMSFIVSRFDLTSPISFFKTLLNVTLITYQLMLTNSLTIIDCFKYQDEWRNNTHSDIVCYDSLWFAQFIFIFVIPLGYCLLYPIVLFIFLSILKISTKKKKEKDEKEEEEEDEDNNISRIKKVLLFLKTLFQKIFKCDDININDVFGMYYLCYRENCWWYECVSMMRKSVIVFLMTYCANAESKLADYLLYIFFGFCFAVHVILRPYKKPFDNLLEGIVLLVLFILQILSTSSLYERYEDLAVIVVILTFLPTFGFVSYLKYRISLIKVLSKIEKCIIQKCYVTCCLCCVPCGGILWWCCGYDSNDRYDDIVLEEREWRHKRDIEDFMKMNQTWVDFDDFEEE